MSGLRYCELEPGGVCSSMVLCLRRAILRKENYVRMASLSPLSVPNPCLTKGHCSASHNSLMTETNRRGGEKMTDRGTGKWEMAWEEKERWQKKRQILRNEVLRKAEMEEKRRRGSQIGDGEMTDEDMETEMTSYTGSGNKYNFNEVSQSPLLFSPLIYLFFLSTPCFSVTSALSLSPAFNTREPWK